MIYLVYCYGKKSHLQLLGKQEQRQWAYMQMKVPEKLGFKIFKILNYMKKVDVARWVGPITRQDEFGLKRAIIIIRVKRTSSGWPWPVWLIWPVFWIKNELESVWWFYLGYGDKIGLNIVFITTKHSSKPPKCTDYLNITCKWNLRKKKHIKQYKKFCSTSSAMNRISYFLTTAWICIKVL